MPNVATFREMQPAARELVGKLFSILQDEVDQLVAIDRSKMTLVERGRWSAQVFRLMQQLQKAFPEADRNTPEGRLTINRLRTPEEEAAEAAEIDALFGFDEPLAKTDRASQERERLESAERQKTPSKTSSRPRSNNLYRSMDASAFPADPSIPVGPPIDYDAEAREILRRIKPSSTAPPRR